ncbi:hypothetical protein F4804DRAFT_347282 [Jackrogersella minutella]|nr:hypothetical protein F4804DRAFT_347282 [Jackrogersella minutella]
MDLSPSLSGVVSFVLTSTLFVYLTYKLIAWRLGTTEGGEDCHQTPANDLSLGLAQKNFGLSMKDIPQGHEENAQRRQKLGRRRPNQFLIIVYNLLFADMHQATAFMLNIPWIKNNKITVDLSASCVICVIAIHTYFDVVKGYKPPHWVLYIAIIGSNGKGAGGFYVRAAAS